MVWNDDAILMKLLCEFLTCVWLFVACLILLTSVVVVEYRVVDVGLVIRKYFVIGLSVGFFSWRFDRSGVINRRICGYFVNHVIVANGV